MTDKEPTPDKLSEIIQNGMKVIGLFSTLAGLISLLLSNRLVAFILLTIGCFLLEIWLWVVWHQGEYIKNAILHGTPLPKVIYTENQRRLAKLTFFCIPIAYAILLIFLERKSYPVVVSMLVPTQTLTQTETFTLTPSQTPTFTFFPSTFTDTPTTTFTFTPLPSNTNTATSTPTITFTPTSTPNPIIFRGLDRNCIDPNYWSIHFSNGELSPDKFGNGCWDLSTRGLNSQDGGLRVNIANIPYAVFSISTKLPNEDLKIHFKIDIETFTSTSSNKAAILVFGIGPADNWVLENGNYLTYSILQGSTTSEILEQTANNKLHGRYLLNSFYSPQNIDVLISITGIDMIMYINGVTYTFYPISLSQPGSRDDFWIGYQLPPNQSIVKATISDFTIIGTK